MFNGNLTENTETNTFTGTLHGRKFDAAIKLIALEKTHENGPNFEIVAKTQSGRQIRIGSAWDEVSKAKNRYISMKIDVGEGPFRVNAVQNEDERGTDEFEIIPFVTNGVVKTGSVNGELTAMDEDNAFVGYVANMMGIEIDFMLIENEYKSDDNHPDYRIETPSPKGVPIRLGSAWLQQSDKGNDYISLVINTPDGDMRVNAVQNSEQRGGNTFSIIPFVDAGAQTSGAYSPLALAG